MDYMNFFCCLSKLNLLCGRVDGHLEVEQSGRSLYSRNEGLLLPFLALASWYMGLTL